MLHFNLHIKQLHLVNFFYFILLFIFFYHIIFSTLLNIGIEHIIIRIEYIIAIFYINFKFFEFGIKIPFIWIRFIFVAHKISFLIIYDTILDNNIRILSITINFACLTKIQFIILLFPISSNNN